MIRLPLNGGAFAKRVADLFCRRRTAAKVLKEWTTPAGLKARVEDREGILWGLVQDSGSPGGWMSFDTKTSIPTDFYRYEAPEPGTEPSAMDRAVKGCEQLAEQLSKYAMA
jgi:hypothetical protein